MIESQSDFKDALHTLDTKVNNVREKTDLLIKYGLKILCEIES